MIIAVDYDGTLDIKGVMNMGLISHLKGRQKHGDIVILWTCRDGKSLSDAVKNLANVGFKPNLVNENTLQSIRKFGYNPRKVFADVYIDDKNIRQRVP